MTAPPYLTQTEVAEICEPLVLPGAQCRYLTSLGLMVKRKPNGHALVARSEFERVLGAGRYAKAQNEAHSGPNVTAMVDHINSRSRHGQTSKGR